MEKIINQSHNQETFFFSLSRMLERAAYYGLRAIIVLYMVSESLEMDQSEALEIYGWSGFLIMLSGIIGAILGDLVIGNKKAIIIGGIIQAIGAFSFCINSITGLYIGLFLVLLGGGLYSPNIISNFGKSYLNKTKLLDSGFTIFYLAINLGAFIGSLLIGYSGDEYGWNIGFILVGILMILSIIPILFSNENFAKATLENEQPLNKSVINILIAVLLVGAFWGIYEISNTQFFKVQIALSELPILDIPKSMWSALNSIFIIPISLLAIVLWSYFYTTQFSKLTMGFIFGAISYWTLFLIPEIPNEQHVILYLVSLLFLAVSETLIMPVVYSILTEFTNPKYLAILISLAFIPSRLFSFFIGLFNDQLYENPSLSILIGMASMTVISIGLIIFNLMKRKGGIVGGDYG